MVALQGVSGNRSSPALSREPPPPLPKQPWRVGETLMRLACLAELKEWVAPSWLRRSWHAVQRLPSIPHPFDDQQVTVGRRSRRLRPLYRALPPAHPAASLRALHSLARVGTQTAAAALLSLSVLLSACSSRVSCACQPPKPEGPVARWCWTEGASFCPEARSRRSTPSANRSVAKPACKHPSRSP